MIVGNTWPEVGGIEQAVDAITYVVDRRTLAR